ncbi:hypothetical protein FHL15_001541 [Xylaria flabelliformis]|uniref:gamma-glutamylcyclotransferase n=1 Tax=Xylaria flabelliformis TaxID=2512241 RepID=A0A553IC69_9PEZI|nr:hypothetical protein FHL15_001541 [Xylaria flabelliformis]
MGLQSDIQVEEALDERSVPAREQGECCLRRLWNSPTWYRRAPVPQSYPPTSSIPKTSQERLALASPDNPSATAKTILYLAYGSNLCAETFLGRRGIRPISQINVSAPAFDLSFDLPGIPYNEPCFANTRPRKIPKPPVIPGKPPKFPPPPPPYSAAPPSSNPTWSKGLYGVVYEVTPEDYANIIKTEGGGQGYHDVLTPCFELPPALHVPEKPPFPELPKPFLAHTLYAPSLPGLPGDDDKDDPKNPGKGDGDDDDDDKDPRKQPWFRRLLLPVHRPDPDYAQASARYLKLIRDGAREHALPDDYQAYLASLQSYTMTSVRQQIGRVLFIIAALPLLLLMIGLGRLLADDVGRTPRWLGIATTACMNFLWAVYDGFFKPLFGDGERTMPEQEARAAAATVIILTDSAKSEKNRLLGDW